MTPGVAGAALDRSTSEAIQAQAVRHWERQRREALNGLLFIAVVTGVIWLVTSGPGSFPWPIFPVLFAIPRASGWLAQWSEMLEDSEQKIARPRQIYTGSDVRDYVPLAKRKG